MHNILVFILSHFASVNAENDKKQVYIRTNYLAITANEHRSINLININQPDHCQSRYDQGQEPGQADYQCHGQFSVRVLQGRAD